MSHGFVRGQIKGSRRQIKGSRGLCLNPLIQAQRDEADDVTTDATTTLRVVPPAARIRKKRYATASSPMQGTIGYTPGE